MFTPLDIFNSGGHAFTKDQVRASLYSDKVRYKKISKGIYTIIK